MVYMCAAILLLLSLYGVLLKQIYIYLLKAGYQNILIWFPKGGGTSNSKTPTPCLCTNWINQVLDRSYAMPYNIFSSDC